MKNLNLMILLLGVAIIFSGCSKDDSLVPGTTPDEQINAVLKFSGTPYSGTTVPAGPPTSFGETKELPNGNVKIFGFTGPWYETVNDEYGNPLPLLSGPSVYCENVTYNKWEPEIHFWGNVEITPEEGGGVWQGQFNGYGYFQIPPDPVTGYNFFTYPTKVEDIVIHLTGHGGDIQGMVVKANYSIDMLNTGLVYYIEGEYK
jgi:hypothetical protein